MIVSITQRISVLEDGQESISDIVHEYNPPAVGVAAFVIKSKPMIDSNSPPACAPPPRLCPRKSSLPPVALPNRDQKVALTEGVAFTCRAVAL